MPDHQALVLLPPLLPLLRERPPNLGIVTNSILAGALRRLEQGEIDLAVGQIGTAPQGYFRRRLYIDRFACLLRNDPPSPVAGMDNRHLRGPAPPPPLHRIPKMVSAG